MANNDLAIRFTENYYASKQEVSKELKMSLIDNIWNNILSYRSYFNRYLTIKSIEKNPLLFCACSSVTSNVNTASSNLLRLTRDYYKLNPESGDLGRFEVKTFGKALSEIAKINQLDVDDMYLRNLVTGQAKETRPAYAFLKNYLNALNFVKTKCASPIDIDFLAELYSVITDNNNLTKFYRTEEDKNPENKVLIDTIYSSAPTKYIEEMINGLFNFIATSNLDAPVKALVTYYYVVYVKPFSQYSDEIGLLLAKAIIGHYITGELGSSLPLETLLTEDTSLSSRIFVEVQRTNDVTYFVNYGSKVLNKACEEISNLFVDIQTTNIRNDFYREETPVQEEVLPQVEVAIAPTPVVAPTPVITPEVTPTPVVAPTPTPVAAPTPTPVVVQPQVQVSSQPQQEIAFNYVPPVLDERAASRLEEHLLELDPTMKRGEAHFYARHCTLGMRYTIQQYKRSLGCAYETARTSMDHLVAMGYYRKEMVKNKNVYTPIAKK